MVCILPRVTQSKNSIFENRVDIETARKDVSQWQKQLQGLLHTNQMFEFPTSLTSSHILDLRNESPSWVCCPHVISTTQASFPDERLFDSENNGNCGCMLGCKLHCRIRGRTCTKQALKHKICLSIAGKFLHWCVSYAKWKIFVFRSNQLCLCKFECWCCMHTQSRTIKDTIE